MQLTLIENLNTQSVVLRHKILVQASGLMMGREGVLETEKDLYLILAFLNNIIQEDLVDECNNDERDLSTIMEDELEPYFFDLIKEDKYKTLYDYTRMVFLKRCQEIWDNQHSIMGVIETILDLVATIGEDEKGDILKGTAEMAKQVYEKRTKELGEKTEKVNDKLEQLVQMYQRKEGPESQERNSAE